MLVAVATGFDRTDAAAASYELPRVGVEEIRLCCGLSKDDPVLGASFPVDGAAAELLEMISDVKLSAGLDWFVEIVEVD